MKFMVIMNGIFLVMATVVALVSTVTKNPDIALPAMIGMFILFNFMVYWWAREEVIK